MGFDPGDSRLIPLSLLDAIADEVRSVTSLASELGASVSIDPQQLLVRDIALSPPGLWSPNRHCRMVEASDGWLAVNLARDEDRDAVPAWLQCEIDVEPWDAIVTIAPGRTVTELVERAILLGMPVSKLGEASAAVDVAARDTVRQHSGERLHVSASAMDRLKVIDLSALWAGPLCGGLLAQVGMAVTKIECSSRPDPTKVSTPLHDQRLNGSKRRVTMDLKSPTLLDAIAAADILITSARPHALARLGLAPDEVFARNPGLIWIAITAYGFEGQNAMRVGFGDDAAAAGGLVAWESGEPRFLGDAIADPLAGLRAAHQAFVRVANGKPGLIDVALAPTAAYFAQKAGLR